MDTCRNGNRETWTWRHGHGDMDMESWTWIHGHGDMDMESWTWIHGHGDMDLKYWGMLAFYKKIKLKPRRFSLIRLLFAFHANRSLTIVNLMM
jgi:hypothetical protein